RDVEERGRGARLGAQALPALLEPLRQAREGGVLALQVRAVEEALLREEEEQEGGHERLDARERGQGETTLVHEEGLVPEGGGGRHREPARHRDEPRRHDGEGVDRAEEERLDPGGGGADAERDPGQIGEALEVEEDAWRAREAVPREPDPRTTKRPAHAARAGADA